MKSVTSRTKSLTSGSYLEVPGHAMFKLGNPYSCNCKHVCQVHRHLALAGKVPPRAVPGCGGHSQSLSENPIRKPVHRTTIP